ncbi:hypothetical protein AZE42_08382 [Rhizopogon vesiculosus]|uniref:F-box domain-containing protein n=1 Tax=Rhizopogon vesiculosus TaxID=180088 RepID=A0A1J8QE98_9AGAM|nr:hypothetical protein AZE42_08382 [Rhizopogon vesiculosus]
MLNGTPIVRRTPPYTLQRIPCTCSPGLDRPVLRSAKSIRITDQILFLMDIPVNNTTIARKHSMHVCLLIPEILKHIFSDIYLSGTAGGLQSYWDCYAVAIPARGVARRSLATLSRVCRSFKDIALDVLWAELDNLEPHFTCLPRDLWTTNEDQKLAMLRPVTTEDWFVFERYASRVRVLGDRDSMVFGCVDAEFVHSIMGFSSQLLLMPNLRALHCGEYYPKHDLHLCVRYLLSPNLVYLRLSGWMEGGFWTNVTSSVLSGLSKHSPRLKVVELNGAPSQVNELALCGLAHLQEVSLLLTYAKAFRFHQAPSYPAQDS